MKRKTAVLLAGTLAVSIYLIGCSGNKASNEYVSVEGYKEVEVEDAIEREETMDKEIDSYIEAILMQYVTHEEIKDRAVESGDTVNIDFVGMMDGQVFDGGSSSGFNLQIGSGSFIEGFEDSIIGHLPGDTFDWSGKFPDSYDNNPDFMGRDVVFTVTVNYICGEAKLPELTDEFVQMVSEESKTVEEYKEEIRKLLSENITTDYDINLQESTWQEVLDKAEIKDYPEDEMEKMKAEIMDAYKNAAMESELEFSDFLEQYYQVSEEEFNKQIEDTVRDNLKERLVARAIAEQEKLIPSEKEMEEELEIYAYESGYESMDDLKHTYEENMGKSVDENNLKDEIILKRVKEYLAENAVQAKK